MKKAKYVGSLVFVLCLVVVSFASAQNPMAEWQKSKHADKELPVNDAATWEIRKTDTALMASCFPVGGMPSNSALIERDSTLFHASFPPMALTYSPKRHPQFPFPLPKLGRRGATQGTDQGDAQEG
jgi:hypothetical protein